MTIDEVKDKVATIKSAAGDNEIAHGMEDNLWENVLTAIMYGAEHPQLLAKEALKTTKIDFCRWTA